LSRLEAHRKVSKSDERKIVKQPFANAFAVAVLCPKGNDGHRVKGSKCELN